MRVVFFVFGLGIALSLGCDANEHQVLSPSKSNQSATPQPFAERPKKELRNAHPVFLAVLPELERRTNVPLLLPGDIGLEPEETDPLYAVLEKATLVEYSVLLGWTPECTGGNVCRYGFVAGRKLKHWRAKGTRVQLGGGVTGYFADAVCGAVCSDSTLSWIHKGYVYTVGIKAGKVEVLTRVANSALETTPRPPPT